MSGERKRIQVFGPGCPRCQETYRVVRHVVEDAGLDWEVTKIEDIRAMAALGIMATPAIVVDGSIVLSGRVPKEAEVRTMLGVG